MQVLKGVHQQCPEQKVIASQINSTETNLMPYPRITQDVRQQVGRLVMACHG